MTRSQLVKKLKNMYDNAPPGQKASMVRLFALLYADELSEYTMAKLNELAEKATGYESYGTELKKMINLHEYVEVKRECREKFN